MKLKKEFPLPWSVKDISSDPRLSECYEICASNNATIASTGTYSGDGDGLYNLDRQQAEELVNIVNSTKKK